MPTGKTHTDTTAALLAAQEPQEQTTAERAPEPSIADILAAMRALQEANEQMRSDNERMKAALWERGTNDTKSPSPQIPFDPEDLKLVTVLYGYGKVGANDNLWVGGANGTTWNFVGGICKDVPWSVAKHWKSNTRPDGGPALFRMECQILPNDSSEVDYAMAVGMPPRSIRETAAIIAASDLEKLAEALPKTLRDQLAQRLMGK